MRKFCGAAILAICMFFQTGLAQADVLIENGGINFFRAAAIPGVMELDVDTGAGQAGNYLLLTCGAFSNSTSNAYNDPDPAIFTELDTDNCESSNNCIAGIWGGFTNDAASQTLTCNTTGTTLIFTAGTLRYSNVDPMSPVIGIQCNEGQGLTATAPSIMTEGGSQVVRIFTSFAFTEVILNDINVAPQMADFSSEASLDGAQVSSIGTSMFFNSAGATGTADQIYTVSPRNWRACTIALRMEPLPPPSTATPPPSTATPPPSSGTPPPGPPTPTPTLIPPVDSESVPTLSQWGHLSVAILAVIIGALFLRRHRARA